MLSIITEYRRGIFFVRLSGNLDIKTKDMFNNKVTDIVKKSGITNLVINLHDVCSLDLIGISELFLNYRLVNKNRGKSFICSINKKISSVLRNSKLLRFIPETNDELNAMRVIKWMN